MIDQDKKKLDSAKDFSIKIDREVSIWDRLGRALPLAVLAIIIISHLFKWNDALGIILEITTIIFFIICAVWWFWVLKKIAETAKHIRSSQEKFHNLMLELKKFKKEIHESDRERGKPKGSKDTTSQRRM